MIEIRVAYEGELRCRAIHGPSGRELETDAPVDNRGRGASFSPTDLLATALGTCMMTLMGIHADRHGLDLGGASLRVEKEMASDPRRVGRLGVAIHLPAGVPREHRDALRRAAEGCPVMRSLAADVAVEVAWSFEGDDLEA